MNLPNEIEKKANKLADQAFRALARGDNEAAKVFAEHAAIALSLSRAMKKAAKEDAGEDVETIR
jgi:hypothetical protein